MLITNRKLKALEAQQAREQARGDRFKAMLAKAKHELVVERRKLDENFCRGSAVTMAAVYAALPTDAAAIALSQLMMASRKKLPPFGLSAETEETVRAETVELLRKAGLDFDGEGPAEIVKEFQL